MDIQTIKPIVLAVITDPRVIIVGILGILFIKFANFVASYRKKPPQKRIRKVATPPPKPKTEEGKGENEEGSEKDTSSNSKAKK